jgi:hypothetical protein
VRTPDGWNHAISFVTAVPTEPSSPNVGIFPPTPRPRSAAINARADMVSAAHTYRPSPLEMAATCAAATSRTSTKPHSIAKIPGYTPLIAAPDIDWSPFDVLLFVSIPAWWSACARHAGSVAEEEQAILDAGAQIVWVLEADPAQEPGTMEG